MSVSKIGQFGVTITAAALVAGCLPIDRPNDLRFTLANDTEVTLVIWEGGYNRGTREPGGSFLVSIGHSRQYCTDDVRVATEDGMLEARNPEICHGDTWTVTPDDLIPAEGA